MCTALVLIGGATMLAELVMTGRSEERYLETLVGAVRA